MRVRLLYKPKPDNYTESCMVNVTDGWRERNVWYQGRSRQRMQMYVHYYERELINEGDNPLIGIVLCADKSESVVKYTLPENKTQIFASKCKLYLPSEEELLRELNQEYQALEAGKTDEENSGDMKLIFCGKRVARTVFVQQKYFSYFRILWGYVLIWYACQDGCSFVPTKTR